MEMYEELVASLRKSADLMRKARHSPYMDWDERQLRQAADAIEELLQKEKFHAFLWNVINPNDMQLYLEMYHSGDEKEKATNES
jgi:hypothetical protein